MVGLPNKPMGSFPIKNDHFGVLKWGEQPQFKETTHIDEWFSNWDTSSQGSPSTKAAVGTYVSFTAQVSRFDAMV